MSIGVRSGSEGLLYPLPTNPVGSPHSGCAGKKRNLGAIVGVIQFPPLSSAQERKDRDCKHYKRFLYITYLIQM